jgi:hypothetical protein
MDGNDRECRAPDWCGCGRCRDDEEYDDFFDDGACCWCGGDGVSECNDRLQCMNRHDKWGNCRCASCGGSGLAKDMTLW